MGQIFDVKVRVRLDAFEKFLQELPMSRSRVVMVHSASNILNKSYSLCYLMSLEACQNFVCNQYIFKISSPLSYSNVHSFLCNYFFSSDRVFKNSGQIVKWPKAQSWSYQGSGL